MYIKELYVRNVDKKISLSNGINVITDENNIYHCALAFLLGFFSKIKKSGDINPKESFDIELSVDSIFNDGCEDFNVSRTVDYNGYFTETASTKISKKQINFVCYQNLNKGLEIPSVYFDNENSFKKTVEYGNRGAYLAKKFITGMFVKKISMEAVGNTDNKEYEYISFHCNNLKKLFDDLLGIVGLNDLEYSIISKKLVCKREKIIKNLNTNEATAQLSTMLFELYYLCMCVDNDGLDTVTQTKGIAVSTFNFGERPSYSDKKWLYYSFFEKTFPNIQFLTI